MPPGSERGSVQILGIFFAGVLFYGLLSRPLARLSITPQIALLALGLAVGVVIRGSPEIEADLHGLETLGEAALVLCLFVDAARIDVGALRGTAGLPVRLLALGLPLTIVAGTAAALIVVPGIALAEAVLLAALVAPTDAALGAAVVTSTRVPLRIRQALNVESGLNDGLVTPIVLVAVAVLGAEADGGSGWVADAASQILYGATAGIIVGIGGALALREVARRDWMDASADWMTGPALAFLAWFVAGQIGGNVFIAAFVAGLAASAAHGRVPRGVLEFGEVAGELLGLAVFFMFAVLVPSLAPFEPAPIAFAILALTVVRMVPVAVSLIGTRLSRPTVLFMGWFGPRGLASIVLGLVAIGEAGGDASGFSPMLFGSLAATVVFSVIAHGLTAGPGVSAYQRRVAALPSEAPEHETVADLPARRALAARPAPGPAPGGGTSEPGTDVA